jgi:hypothetical protein
MTPLTSKLEDGSSNYSQWLQSRFGHIDRSLEDLRHRQIHLSDAIRTRSAASVGSPYLGGLRVAPRIDIATDLERRHAALHVERPPTNRIRGRLWPRYSLRTLFIALTVFGLVGGYRMNKTYRQREAVRRFYALTAEARPQRGTDLVTLAYRHQGRDEYYKPIIPKWLHPLRDLIGEEAFGEVT